MKTAVLGQSPAFPINIVDAFSLLGEAELFCATQSDYRQQHEGTLLTTKEACFDAREFINKRKWELFEFVHSERVTNYVNGLNLNTG